jgi:transcriptional regulator with XRE-family HTH domain
MGDRKAPARVFGEVLRELRLSKGLTQDQLADRAETERSHISSLERAEKGPSLSTIFALAAALQMDAGDLVFRVERRLKVKKR